MKCYVVESEPMLERALARAIRTARYSAKEITRRRLVEPDFWAASNDRRCVFVGEDDAALIDWSRVPRGHRCAWVLVASSANDDMFRSLSGEPLYSLNKPFGFRAVKQLLALIDSTLR